MNEEKIVFVTRYSNPHLYKLSKATTDPISSERIPFEHTIGGDGYLRIIFELPYDWIVNVDDDAFVVNKDSIQTIITHMKENGYDYCGIPDGGNTTIRGHANPCSMNPFFNIFNLKSMREKMELKNIRGIPWSDDLKDRVPDKCKTRSDLQWYPLLEPYYPIFFQLLKHCKALFLDADTYDVDGDAITSRAYDTNNSLFLYHTWYARDYLKDVYPDDVKHTRRIQKIMRVVCEENGMDINNYIE